MAPIQSKPGSVWGAPLRVSSCMCCVRTHVLEYSRSLGRVAGAAGAFDPLKDMEFPCPRTGGRNKTGTSVSCDQCLSRHKLCEKAVALMEGDFHDLVELVGAAEVMWMEGDDKLLLKGYQFLPVEAPADADGNDYFVFPDKCRVAAAKAVVKLIHVFVNTETRIRSAHGQTGSLKSRDAKTFDAVVSSRRAALAAFRQSSTPRRARMDPAQWDALNLLRLRASDPGYDAWTAAKAAFKAELIVAYDVYIADLVDEQAAAFRQEMAGIEEPVGPDREQMEADVRAINEEIQRRHARLAGRFRSHIAGVAA